MKNRKNKNMGFIIALIAIVGLGIGYAAIVGNPLNINGTATVDDFRVVFDTTTPHVPVVTDNTGNSRIATYSYTSGGNTTATTAAYSDELNATFDLHGYNTVNDTAYVEYKIVNKSASYAADLAMTDSVSGDTSYFTVTYAFSATQAADPSSLTYAAAGSATYSNLAANGSVYLYAKVVLSTAPVDYDETISDTITITPTVHQ